MAYRSVVISIHSKYAEAILSGTKRVELRKTPFPKDISEVIMYATSPIRYLIGRFYVDAIVVDKPDRIFTLTQGLTTVDIEAFDNYYEGKNWAVAVYIRSPQRFTRMVDPEKYIRLWTPPRSWRYITWEQHDRIVHAGSRPAEDKNVSPMGAGSGRGSDSPPSSARPVIDDKEG